jgi:hypothetical protein
MPARTRKLTNDDSSAAKLEALAQQALHLAKKARKHRQNLAMTISTGISSPKSAPMQPMRSVSCRLSQLGIRLPLLNLVKLYLPLRLLHRIDSRRFAS